MARFVRTESGSVFTITDPPCELLELVDGAWAKPVSPVGFTDLMDGTPLSETDVEKMIKTPRYVRTEDGRVLNDTGDPSVRVLELVDGVWVKPSAPVLFTEMMDGRELTEEELSEMMNGTGSAANSPRFVRTEDGRVFRLSASELAELVDGTWVSPVAPVFGGELMDATPLSAAEIASIRVREIEARAEARTYAMLDRLIEKRMKSPQAAMPTTTTAPAPDNKVDEAPPAKGFIGKVKTWLNASNSGFLWVLSKYLPVGCLVCVGPGNVFSFGGNTLEFIATALFYAVIAFVFTETVDHMLGENATNLRRIKAIAAEVVFAAAMFWWLID